jgi:hypothetical protein
MIFVPVVFLAVFAPIAQTYASNQNQEPTVFTTTGANDFYFELEAGTTFTIRATAQQYGIDSMFWLYNSNNQLLAANDDFYGLDSYISYNVQEAGTYRLRTGVCCGDPNRWYGNSYTVETNSLPTGVPSTTTTSTTTTTTSTTTTTTTLPPLGMRTPTNLRAFAYEGRVALSWDEPEGGEGYAPVERYAILFTDDNWQTSRAIASTNTWATVYNLENGTEYQFRVRADNDTLGVYSSTIETFTVRATPVTTTTTTTSTTTTSTTTTTTTTTSTIPETTTTSIFVFPTLPPVDTEEPVETPPSQSDTESTEPVTSVPQYAEEQEKPAEETPIEVPQETQDIADAAVADIFDEPISDAKLADAVENLVSDAGTPEELTAVVNSLLDQELTDEQFSTVIDSVFSEPLSDENFSAAVDAVFADVSELSDEQFDTAVQAVFDEPLSVEQFSAALDAVFDEPLSDEKFDAVIDAVLDAPLSDEQFEELVGVLESDTVTEEQVAAAVDSVIENGVTEEQATDLATSAKVLESIDGDQATEIFDAVDISAVTAEEAAQLVEAVQDAPTEVREALESEVNIFQGAIDTYVPLGSSVPIGTRRVIIGASALAIFSAPVPVSRRN